jgi:hypothetical protein
LLLNTHKVKDKNTEDSVPGLELHTLNQVETEAAMRAGDGAIAGRLVSRAAEKSPVTTGDFSLPQLDEYLGFKSAMHISSSEGPAFTVLEDYLPPVEIAERDFDALHDSELVGDLMHQARISKLTGCIMRPDAYRNSKGYSKTGIKAVRELGLGTSSREAHRVVHFARMAESTGRLPTLEDLSMEVDHICRNPACLYHTRSMKPEFNNALRGEATRIEPDIVSGQTLYITDLLHELPWLTYALAEEGGIPAKVISTRLGPYALRLVHPDEFVVYGERVACDVYDSLKPPGKKSTRRKSRARLKKIKPIKDHSDLFPKTKYRKKYIASLEEKYEAARRAA